MLAPLSYSNNNTSLSLPPRLQKTRTREEESITREKREEGAEEKGKEKENEYALEEHANRHMDLARVGEEAPTP